MENKYMRLEKLGSGSYGDVYKGIDVSNNNLVAMKKIVANLFDNGFPAPYLREVSLLQTLRHENIVHYIDILWIESSHIYLIFEYMMNDLRTYMDDCEPKGMRLTALQSYFYQIVNGLEFCHARAIIHRDLKPENILIDHRGVVKIADFGLSRTISIPARAYTLLVVTLWYRAPELLFGLNEYACPLDIWSLGCIFAEMVTGQPLFSGDSEIDQCHAIVGVLGSPKDEDWPGVTSLPNYSDSFSKKNRIGLEKKVLIRGPGLELLELMLTYNPAKRISAKRILDHQYFNSFDRKKMWLPVKPINSTGMP